MLRVEATGWDISGFGDPSIQGFAINISINAGETVFFKIDTDAPIYRLEIYRLGYYGGDGASFSNEAVAEVPPL